jgi:hypothetical protein
MSVRGKQHQKRKKPLRLDPETRARLRGPVRNPVLSVALRETTSRGVIVGGTRYGSSDGEGWTLDLVDLDAGGALARLPLLFLPHGFAPHPRRPWEAALLEKWGGGGAYVDLLQQKILRVLRPKPNHEFYGHGVFSVDGEVLFAVEMNLESREGVITVRDGATFRIIDEFPSYGQAPHDCVFIDGGRTLAITNAGAFVGSTPHGSVSFVSVADRRLLDRRPIDSTRINAGHIAMTEDGEFAVVSAAREGLPKETALGGVSLCAGSDRLTLMSHPPEVTGRLAGEALSVCVHEPTRHVCVTHPYSNLVTIWDLSKKILKRTLELDSPRGVTLTLDGRAFALSYGSGGHLALFDAETLEAGPIVASHVLSGSHVYAWAYPASV